MPHGSVLRIEPVRFRKDHANFTCVADNDIGDSARATAKLHVYPMNKDRGKRNSQGLSPQFNLTNILTSIMFLASYSGSFLLQNHRY